MRIATARCCASTWTSASTATPGRASWKCLKALRDNQADVGALGDTTWAKLLAEGKVDPKQDPGVLDVAGLLPLQLHGARRFPGRRRRAWTNSLVAMRYDDPQWRELMDLEGLKRWLPADAADHEGLRRAVRGGGGARTAAKRIRGPVACRFGRRWALTRLRSPITVMMRYLPEPAARIEGGALGVGDGLLMLIREAADPLPAGAVDRRSHFRHVGRRTTCRPGAGSWRTLTSASDEARHTSTSARATSTADRSRSPTGASACRCGPAANCTRATGWSAASAEVPEHATGATGFAPRGAVVEPGSPIFDFAINDRDKVWAAEVADLYEQATAGQWDASRDIPWAELKPLPEPLERAVCQLMTFLAENEYSALYVPAKFVPRINPQFAEVVFFLCTQMMDEARHIEAFTKRALANGGGLQYSAASTQLSLKTLFDQHDFTVASFLLSVLGEGTFLDLLQFIEDHAPDPVTAEVCRRARADETRHVTFRHGPRALLPRPGPGPLRRAARAPSGSGRR